MYPDGSISACTQHLNAPSSTHLLSGSTNQVFIYITTCSLMLMDHVYTFTYKDLVLANIYLAKNDYSLDLKSIPHYIKSESYESTPPNCIKSVSYESTEKHSIFAPNDNIAEMVKNRGSTQKPPGTFLKITTISSKLTRHIGWPLFTLTKLVPMSYTIKNKCIPGLVATCMTKHGILCCD